VGKETEDPEIARMMMMMIIIIIIIMVVVASVSRPYKVVERNIQKLRNNNASGEDNITAELIKYGGKAVIEAVHKLMTLIWETEQMPDNWRIRIMCPILKKGAKLDCNNYRGITLLNILYKILSNLINEKFIIATKRIIGEYQCALRPNKGTIDQLLIIKQMMEKHYEHELDLHVLYTDFTQTFDCVNREKLFEIMYKYGIPKKLIRLVQMSMSTT
jgi:sorting nexin-29